MPMVERSRLIEQELDALYQVSRELNSPAPLRDKLQRVLEILHEQAGMRSGMLALREQQTDALVVCLIRHDDDGSPSTSRYATNPVKD